MSDLNGPGLASAIPVAILVGLVSWILYGCVRAASTSRLGINPFVGIRVPAVMKSPAAWKAGHAAAQRWCARSAAFATLAMVASVLLSRSAVLYLVVLGLALVGLLGGLVIATVSAVGAARRTE